MKTTTTKNQVTATVIIPALNKDSSIKKGTMLIPRNVKVDAIDKFCDMVYFTSIIMSLNKNRVDYKLAKASHDKVVEKRDALLQSIKDMNSNDPTYETRIELINIDIAKLDEKISKSSEKIATLELIGNKVTELENIFLESRINAILFESHSSKVFATGKGSKALNEKSEVIERIKSLDEYESFYNDALAIIKSDLLSSTFVYCLVWMYVKYNGEKLENNGYELEFQGMNQLYQFLKRYDTITTSGKASDDELKRLNNERREVIENVAHTLNTTENNVFTNATMNVNFKRCQRISNQFTSMRFNASKGTVSDKSLDAYGVVQLVFIVTYMMLTNQETDTINNGLTLDITAFMKKDL